MEITNVTILKKAPKRPLEPIPFDPFKRSKDVEKLVMEDEYRRYYGFQFDPKFYGGIISARASGCNLLCAYCWNIARNTGIESCQDKFFDPDEVAQKIQALLSKNPKIERFRITGCEAILGVASAKHLGDVIKKVKGSNAVIETNGLMIGSDPSLLSHLPKKTLVRVTIKADNAKDFERITGSKSSAYDRTLEAIRALNDSKRPYTIAFMKQFVDLETLGGEFDRLGIVIDEKYCQAIDIEGLLYYPPNTKSMKERGLTPIYTKVKK